jgi:hypothetical protein
MAHLSGCSIIIGHKGKSLFLMKTGPYGPVMRALRIALKAWEFIFTRYPSE